MTTRRNKFRPRGDGRTIDQRQQLRDEQAEYRRRFHGYSAKPEGSRIVDAGGNYPDMFWTKP